MSFKSIITKTIGVPRILLMLAGLLLLGLLIYLNHPTRVTAAPADLASAEAKYPNIFNTRIDTCALCHTSAPKLNPYGAAYKAAGRSLAAFGAIESADSDGDGWTNIQEIMALTFPGDPNDHPAGTPPVPTSTSTPTITRTPFQPPSATPTATHTSTPTATRTQLPGASPTATNTPLPGIQPPTATHTLVPSATNTGMPKPSKTPRIRPSRTPTATLMPGINPSSTPTEICQEDDDSGGGTDSSQIGPLDSGENPCDIDEGHDGGGHDGGGHHGGRGGDSGGNTQSTSTGGLFLMIVHWLSALFGHG
jgi:hypothetical protein